MLKILATKKRIAYGRVLKRMKKGQGCYTIADFETFPMLLKRNCLDMPYVHTKNRQKVRYRLLRRLYK
jgi:hypothetical protein